jgi:hypothetical protein
MSTSGEWLPALRLAGETPTPPQSGGLRGFWARRSKWGKAVIIIGAVATALVAIGLAVPALDDPENTSAQVADEETTTEEATEDTATEPDPTTEEAVAEGDDGGTGRMSRSEHAWFAVFVRWLNEEIDQLETALPECAVLFRASPLAAASECLDDAYHGFGRRFSFVDVTVDDLRDDGDVAKQCLAAMNAYQERLNSFDAFVERLHRAGANLQAERFTRIRRQATGQVRAYRTARDAALLTCEPQS